MQQNEPLISIVLPVRNAENSIKACVKSLLCQTYKNIEIIAVDDKSIDNSYTILKDLRKIDKRLKASRNKKQYGLSVSLNRSIRKARGKYVAFMNQNGTSLPSRLKIQLNFLVQNPKIAVIGCQTIVKDQKRKTGISNFPQEPEMLEKTLFNQNSIEFESCMINTQLLPKDILYFTNQNYPFLFIDLFLKISQYARFSNLNRPLYIKQIQNKTAYDNLRFFVSIIKLWLKSEAAFNRQFSLKSLLFPIKQAFWF